MTFDKSIGGQILCVGIATLDVISLLPEFPDSNSRVLASQMVFAGGGPGATAAVTLARLGHQVKLITSVGFDELGRLVLFYLDNEGVDLSAIERERNNKTSVSQVLVNSTTGDRIIITKPDAHGQASANHFDFDIPATWVHLDQAGYAAISANCKRKKIFERHLISIDGGNYIEDLDLEGVALYVPTLEQLQEIYGYSKSIGELLLAAMSAGAQVVVATDGSNGCYTYIDGEVWHSPAQQGNVVSTLGAGDVFHGALLAAIVDGKELKDAMEFANLCAFMSCAGLDGRSAIPTKEELEKNLNDIKLRS